MTKKQEKRKVMLLGKKELIPLSNTKPRKLNKEYLEGYKHGLIEGTSFMFEKVVSNQKFSFSEEEIYTAFLKLPEQLRDCYMLMYEQDGNYYFKHEITRKYVYINKRAEQKGSD